MAKETNTFIGKAEGGIYQAWENNWPKLKEIDTNSFRGLVEINKLTSDVFFQDSVFAEHWNILGSGPDETEAVRQAVSIHNFPAQKMVEPEKYSKLLEATQVKEQLARSYILKHLSEGATFGLKPWELEVLSASARTAGEFDDLCQLWRDEVPNNPLNELAKQSGLTNQYSVINKAMDWPVEISYAEAFPEQIEKITDTFSQLSASLAIAKEPESEQLAMADYLQAYANALGSTDLDKLPDLWRESDRLWLLVRGRVQPIASREYDYYDPNAIRVFPDFRLAIVNEETKLGKSVEATRLAMIKHLETEFGGVGIFEETKDSMNKIQILPETYDVVFAGCFDFQPVGQFLPNEFEVKKKYGIKVFLNPDVSANRWQLALELAKKVFPQDLHLFERLDREVDGHTAGHEIGEPLFDTDEVRTALGGENFRLLNEDSATLAITAIMPHRFKDGEISREALENHVIDLLATYLRYLAFARGAPHLEPYYLGMGLQGLRRMVDSGFVKFEKDQLRIDLAAIDKLYEQSLMSLKWQVGVADKKSTRDALSYLRFVVKEAATPGNFVEDLPVVKRMIDLIHPKP